MHLRTASHILRAELSSLSDADRRRRSARGAEAQEKFLPLKRAYRILWRPWDISTKGPARDDLPDLVIKRYRRSTHGRHKRTLIIAGDCSHKGGLSSSSRMEGPRDLDIYAEERSNGRGVRVATPRSGSLLRDQDAGWTLNQLERTRRSRLPRRILRRDEVRVRADRNPL